MKDKTDFILFPLDESIWRGYNYWQRFEHSMFLGNRFVLSGARKICPNLNHSHENKVENQTFASEGGAAAGDARVAVEKRTGKPVITNKNAVQLQDLVTGLIEADISKKR